MVESGTVDSDKLEHGCELEVHTARLATWTPREKMAQQPSAFVRYGRSRPFVPDFEDDPDPFCCPIIGVNEFQIARALIAGNLELLSQKIDSQHLFTLCLKFGQHETAAEMQRKGVPGCKVEVFHLGPYATKQFFMGAPLFHGLEVGCACRKQWHNCRSCCWGFNPSDDLWMRDWYATREDAQHFAQDAADTPLFRALDQALRSGDGLPHDVLTEAAKARVFDIATWPSSGWLLGL